MANDSNANVERREAWDALVQMREDRDRWKARAEGLEKELVAIHRLTGRGDGHESTAMTAKCITTAVIDLREELSDIERDLADAERRVVDATKALEASDRHHGCEDVQESHLAEIDRLRSALIRIATYVNVDGSVGRLDPDPDTIALWCEQAIDSTVRGFRSRLAAAEAVVEAARDCSYALSAAGGRLREALREYDRQKGATASEASPPASRPRE